MGKFRTAKKLSITEMNRLIRDAGPALMPSDSLHALIQHVYAMGQNVAKEKK